VYGGILKKHFYYVNACALYSEGNLCVISYLFVYLLYCLTVTDQAMKILNIFILKIFNEPVVGIHDKFIIVFRKFEYLIIILHFNIYPENIFIVK